MGVLVCLTLLLVISGRLGYADSLASLPVHLREGTRPEAMLFLGGKADNQFGWVGTQTYAVLPDGSLEEWKTGVFGFSYGFELSADRRVMLVNARGGYDPQGPTSIFTPNVCYVYPPADYNGRRPPLGGRLSADGKRAWFSELSVSAYDTGSGEQVLSLPMPSSPGQSCYPLDFYNSPEFVEQAKTAWFMGR